jgi:hypothetical protein
VVRLVIDLKHDIRPQVFTLAPVAAYRTGWCSTCTRQPTRPAGALIASA